MMHKSYANLIKWVVLALLSAVVFYVVALVYASGQTVVGSVALAGYVLAAYVFTSKRTYTQRYLFPGLAGITLFVLFPLLFTVWIGFTNYSSTNLLTFERATDVLLSQTYRKSDENYLFTLYPEGNAFRLVLTPEVAEADEPEEQVEETVQDEGSIFDEEGGENDPGEQGEGGGEDEGSIFDEESDAGAGEDDAASNADAAAASDAGAAAATDAAPEAQTDAAARASDGGVATAATAPGTNAEKPARAPQGKSKPAGPFVTKPISLTSLENVTVEAVPLEGSGVTLGEPLTIRAVIERQAALGKVTVVLPDGTTVANTGLRTFAAERRLYAQNPDGSLTNQQTGAVLVPNHDTGFYETKDGEQVTPGFRVMVGLGNFARIFTDPNFQGPFFRIFLWTVTFAGLTVLLTLIVGALLAELLDWEGLRFRGVYRVLLFVPYAVPGFISILVFKGLFNENYGEVNLILSKLFGIQPTWFSDPFLAKVMILIVNTWLGYPYVMLLCMGLRQSIPKDLYEATALAGAGPFTNYFKITWPLIRRPLTPLLISSFAFNFNNFVLIALLTGGRPDFIGTKVPAGTTDILVSYTYRIAFEDSGKNFGLAAAISTVIFFMVAALSVANLKLTKVNEVENR